MKHLTALLLLATASAAAFAGGLLAHRDAAEPTETVRSVDVARVLEEFEPFTATYEALKAKYKPEVDLLRQMSESIKQQQGELASMDQNSEQYRVQSFEVEVLQKTLQAKFEFWDAAQRRERERLLQMSVSRIYEACAEYGRRSGIGAVVMKPAPLPEAGETSSAALRDLESRWVIWAHADHDVTDQILAILREAN
jgi:Skp family chaperone for outer membrane proteins